jgi:hypothetical protein
LGLKRVGIGDASDSKVDENKRRRWRLVFEEQVLRFDITVADTMVVKEQDSIRYRSYAPRRISLIEMTDGLDPLEQGATFAEFKGNVKLAGGLKRVEEAAEVFVSKRFQDRNLATYFGCRIGSLR